MTDREYVSIVLRQFGDVSRTRGEDFERITVPVVVGGYSRTGSPPRTSGPNNAREGHSRATAMGARCRFRSATACYYETVSQ
jgi:hypothetical protein